jgi:hypothetical protein
MLRGQNKNTKKTPIGFRYEQTLPKSGSTVFPADAEIGGLNG